MHPNGPFVGFPTFGTAHFCPGTLVRKGRSELSKGYHFECFPPLARLAAVISRSFDRPMSSTMNLFRNLFRISQLVCVG